MTDRVDLHNKLAGDLTKGLIKPMVAAGASPSEIIVLLESVALGVFLFMSEEATIDGTIDSVVDTFAGGVKLRLAEQIEARKRRAS